MKLDGDIDARQAEHERRIALIPAGMPLYLRESFVRLSEAARDSDRHQRPGAPQAPPRPSVVLGAMFRGAAFYNAPAQSDPGHVKAREWLKDWAKDPIRNKYRWVLLSGGVGTGKTRNIAEISNAWSDVGINHRVFKWSAMIEGIESEKREEPFPTTDEICAKRKYMPHLIDEVSTMNVTGPRAELINLLFDGWYANQTPLVMATNLPIDDWRDYIGERITDRACDVGFMVLPYTWKSYRGQG